jgi:DedD protein
MESRAKQRLTGAIILVALFVLLVPELLTGPRNSQPPAETTADDGLRRYTIDLNAQNATGQSAAPPSQQAPVALPPVAEPMGATQGRAVPGEAAAPAAAPPASKSPSLAASSPAAAPASRTPAAAPLAATPAPSPHTATPPVETPRAPPAAAPVRGNFVVQLGSFSSRENADRLVHDMTARGFTAFIAPITTNGRELYRVRVGPTKDRTSAEALAVELKRIGQSGSIVPIS